MFHWRLGHLKKGNYRMVIGQKSLTEEQESVHTIELVDLNNRVAEEVQLSSGITPLTLISV